MVRSRDLLLLYDVHNAVLVGKVLVVHRQNRLVDAIDEDSLLDLNDLKVFFITVDVISNYNNLNYYNEL